MASSGRTSTASTGTTPSLGGGVLPTGSALTPITLVNAVPSSSSSDSMALDLVGRDDEIGRYCPSTTDCQCLIQWTIPGTSNSTDTQTAATYAETNLLRCRYDVVPREVSQFKVSILVLSGNMQSNKITLNTPSVPTTQLSSNASNFLKVQRYQCKDILTSNSRYYGSSQTSLQDPQIWQMSMSFNFYSASLGEDYGGSVSNFECPMSPTDERNVIYQQDRYWPDVLPSGTAGPRGIDGRCGVLGSASTCDCPGGTPLSTTVSSLFDGQGTSAGVGCTNVFNPSVEYNSRSKVFGVTSGNTSARSGTNGTTEDEPYDMALYSTRPLSGYDNVIFPTNLDEGSRTTLGVNNDKNKDQPTWLMQNNGTTFNFECSDGIDPDLCKCVTGLEKDCRKYAANRHDFYVSNFYDSTFRAPFCAPHTAGGANAQNSIRLLQSGGLDCTIDTSQSPPLRGRDVLGYVAYPTASGSCPSTTLPEKKKWALLWRFRAQLPKRAVIDITNTGDIGLLMCTSKEDECTDDQTNSWTVNNSSADITNHQAANASNSSAGGAAAGRLGHGARYCQTARGRNEQFKTGVFTVPDQGSGYRYGNCLQIPRDPTTSEPGSLLFPSGAPPGDGTTGWRSPAVTIGQCQWTDGFGPYSLQASADRSPVPVSISGVGGSFRLFSGTDNTLPEYALNPSPTAGAVNDRSGCYDPAQLYFQPTFCIGGTGCSGFANFINTFGWGCVGRSGGTDTQKIFGYALDNNSAYATFDWQGFPFIAGDYTTLPAGMRETSRGVGSGGNFCNPTLPGSRWSGVPDTSFSWNAGQLAGPPVQTNPGYGDGKDVWLVGGSQQKLACIEADTDNNFGFLYNVYATRNPADATNLKPANHVNRLPGLSSSATPLGFPGLVGAFPKTIKNWFDFVGIGCLGKCDNSSASDSYPKFPWVAGVFNGVGQAGTTPSYNASIAGTSLRSGPHSSTDSWGGYGIFQFGTVDLEQTGMVDVLYVVSPTGITLDQMERDQTLQDQFRPVRYINGYKVEYNLDVDSQSSTTPSLRLPQFPVCVLQDKEG